MGCEILPINGKTKAEDIINIVSLTYVLHNNLYKRIRSSISYWVPRQGTLFVACIYVSFNWCSEENPVLVIGM